MLETLAWIALLLIGSPSSDGPHSQAQVRTQATPAAATFRVTGRVVNSLTQAPVARAYVAISSARDSNMSRTVRTGTDGSFVLTQIPAGRYVLRARRKGYVEQMFLQHEEFTTAILVGPNLDSEDLIFPLPPEGVISGEVTDEAGEPVLQAEMLLFSENVVNGRHVKHLEGQRYTDDEGRYKFGHLNAGNYYLAASAEPWYAKYTRPGGGAIFFENKPGNERNELRNPGLDVVYPITYYPNATDASGAAAMCVEAGGNARADMRLSPVPALHISVQLGENEPSTSAQIRATQTIFGVYEEQSVQSSYQFGSEGDEEGEGAGSAGQKPEHVFIELDGLRPGPMVVQVMTSEVKDAGKMKITKSVQIDPAEGQMIDVSRTAPAAVVRGTVKLEGGAPAPGGVGVIIANLRQGSSYRADVESDGSFKFDGETFKPGMYRLFALAPGGLQLWSISATGARVDGHKIEIGSAGDIRLELILARGVNARVKGIVEREGKPAAGMMVVLVPEKLEDFDEYRRDQSDSDGSFSMNLVSPGSYTVVAVNDWQLEWAKPEVMRQYLAGGEPVVVAGGEERAVRVTAK
jgi:hypothetical protein